MGDAFTWAITIAAWEVRTVRKQMARSRTTFVEGYDSADPAESPEARISREQLVTVARQVLGTLSESESADSGRNLQR